MNLFEKETSDEENAPQWRCWWSALPVLASLACQKKAQVKGIELAVNFSDKTLTDNLITDVQYDWKTGGDFAKDGEGPDRLRPFLARQQPALSG